MIKEKPHQLFQRQDDDLLMKYNISLKKALVGFSFDFLDICGNQKKYKIVDVVKPNTIKIFSNEGMPNSKNPNIRGNLRVNFNIDFPNLLSPHQKEVLDNIL